MTTEQLQRIIDFVHEAEEMLVDHNGGAVDPAIRQQKLEQTGNPVPNGSGPKPNLSLRKQGTSFF